MWREGDGEGGFRANGVGFDGDELWREGDVGPWDLDNHGLVKGVGRGEDPLNVLCVGLQMKGDKEVVEGALLEGGGGTVEPASI